MAECVNKNDRLSRHSFFIAVICVLFLGLVWRIFCWRAAPVISRDGVYYISLIANARDGMPMDNPEELPPLLYMTLAGRIAALGIPVEFAAIGISLLCGTLLPLLIFLIAERLWHDRCVSFGALTLVMFYPPFVKWSYMIQRESLYLFLVASALLLAVWSRQNMNYFGFFSCGFVAALAIWTRYEGLELIALLLIWALMLAIFCRDERKMVWAGILSGVVGLFLGYIVTACFVHQPSLYIFMKVRCRLC